MSTVIEVDGIKVSALNDGEVHLPLMFYPGLDFGAHPELLQADGTYHIPVGCFLIQAEDLTVLVDTGLGPSSIPFPGDIAAGAGLTDPPESIAAGGLLPGALAAPVSRRRISPPSSSPICTPTISGGSPPVVLCPFPTRWSCAVPSSGKRRPSPPRLVSSRAGGGSRSRRPRGCSDRSTRQPSSSRRVSARITALATLPGHYVVRVCSNGEAAYLLGDVVHHPLQLNDQGISFLSEAEPERALRVREELLTALQGRSVSIGMAHFPGLDFQQIAMADGRAWSTAGYRLTQTCPIWIWRIRFVNWRARSAQNVAWRLTTPDVAPAPSRVRASGSRPCPRVPVRRYDNSVCSWVGGVGCPVALGTSSSACPPGGTHGAPSGRA